MSAIGSCPFGAACRTRSTGIVKSGSESFMRMASLAACVYRFWGVHVYCVGSPLNGLIVLIRTAPDDRTHAESDAMFWEMEALVKIANMTPPTSYAELGEFADMLIITGDFGPARYGRGQDDARRRVRFGGVIYQSRLAGIVAAGRAHTLCNGCLVFGHRTGIWQAPRLPSDRAARQITRKCLCAASTACLQSNCLDPLGYRQGSGLASGRAGRLQHRRALLGCRQCRARSALVDSRPRRRARMNVGVISPSDCFVPENDL